MNKKEMRAKLKQCTKDELIHIIVNYGLELHVIEAALVAIQGQRVKKWMEEESRMSDLSQAALNVYREILEPYEGIPIKELPEKVKKQAKEVWNEYVRLSGEWDKISKRINKLLLKG